MNKPYEIVSNIRQKRITESLIQDQRLDGRGLMDYRKIAVDVGLIEKASGSAQVSIGKTKVLIGIKVETGEPYSDKPDAGVLTVNVELVPIASPRFEPGPPTEDAVELARVVDRGIRESQAVDLNKLCIIPGKLVFVLFVDVYVLDHDGNLVDAAALAGILALINTKIREYSVSDDGRLEYQESTVNLPLQNYPVEVTIAKIGGKLFVDPTLEETALIDAQITIATGQKDEICAIQKSRVGTVSVDEVSTAIDIAIDKAKAIRKEILEAYLDG